MINIIERKCQFFWIMKICLYHINIEELSKSRPMVERLPSVSALDHLRWQRSASVCSAWAVENTGQWIISFNQATDGVISSVGFCLIANKTSPATMTAPVITHVTDGRRWRRRAEGLGAERQRMALEVIQSVPHSYRLNNTARKVKASPFCFRVLCAAKQEIRAD